MIISNCSLDKATYIVFPIGLVNDYLQVLYCAVYEILKMKVTFVMKMCVLLE